MGVATGAGVPGCAATGAAAGASGAGAAASGALGAAAGASGAAFSGAAAAGAVSSGDAAGIWGSVPSGAGPASGAVTSPLIGGQGTDPDRRPVAFRSPGEGGADETDGTRSVRASEPECDGAVRCPGPPRRRCYWVTYSV